MILLIVLFFQAFSGEFTGGDKIPSIRDLPTRDKGEVTGGDKPIVPKPRIPKKDEPK